MATPWLWHTRGIADWAAAIAIAIMLLLTADAPAQYSQAGEPDNAPRVDTASHARLAHARRLLHDARHWAEFGNLQAARDLAQRALDLNAAWPAGELTPQMYLQQLTQKNSAPSQAPTKIPAPPPEAAARADTDLSMGTSMSHAQAASYQVPTAATGESAVGDVVMHTTLPTPERAHSPSPVVMLTPPALPPVWSPHDRASRSAPRAATSTTPDVPDQTTAPPLRRDPSMPIVPSQAPIKAPAPANTTATPTNSSMVTFVLACGLGMLLFPALVLAGGAIVFRVVGKCTPIVRIELHRHDTAGSPPDSNQRKRRRTTRRHDAQQRRDTHLGDDTPRANAPDNQPSPSSCSPQEKVAPATGASRPSTAESIWREVLNHNFRWRRTDRLRTVTPTVVASQRTEYIETDDPLR